MPTWRPRSPTINRLLAQFDTVNTSIVKGTNTGDDVTDYLDLRDGIISKLSQEIGITVSIRPNSDTAIYTDSGVMLYDKSARTVSFAPDQRLYGRHDGKCGLYRRRAGHRRILRHAAQVGQDRGPRRTARQGDGHLPVPARRNRARPDRSLREIDQSGAAVPDMPGLFTYPGAPAMPAAATVSLGLAGTITVDASVDPASAEIRNCCATARSAAMPPTLTIPPAWPASRRDCNNSSTTWRRRSLRRRRARASRAASVIGFRLFIGELDRKPAQDGRRQRPLPEYAARPQQCGAFERQWRQHGRRNVADAAGRTHLFGVVEDDFGGRRNAEHSSRGGELTMMSANYVSTLMLSSSLRYSITNNQSALSKRPRKRPPAGSPIPACSLARPRGVTSGCAPR